MNLNSKFLFQRAIESLQFYKGNEAILKRASVNSDPIALAQQKNVNENEKQRENSTDDDEDDLNSPLTFKDFCKF